MSDDEHENAYREVRQQLGLPEAPRRTINVFCQGPDNKTPHGRYVWPYVQFDDQGPWFPLGRWSDGKRSGRTRATRRHLVDNKPDYAAVPLPTYGEGFKADVPSWLTMVPEELKGQFRSQYRFDCPHCELEEKRNDTDGKASAALFGVLDRLAENGVPEISVRALIRLAWH